MLRLLITGIFSFCCVDEQDLGRFTEIEVRGRSIEMNREYQLIAASILGQKDYSEVRVLSFGPNLPNFDPSSSAPLVDLKKARVRSSHAF